jgi:Mce-associated membrane protein
MADNADPAGELTMLIDDDVDIDNPAESVADDATDAPGLASREPMPPVWHAMLFGSVVVLVIAVLAGWLGFRAYQSHEEQAQRSHFLQAAKEVALNLTTIDWHQAEGDVQRILDGATGQFHDDFAMRSQPFVDVVKQAESTSVGTITEAGLESEGAGSAQVLVAVAVKTSNAGVPEQDSRAWRMRVSVEKVGDQAKVSNVEFVS